MNHLENNVDPGKNGLWEFVFFPTIQPPMLIIKLRSPGSFCPCHWYELIRFFEQTYHLQTAEGLQKKTTTFLLNLCEGYLEWEVPSIDVIYSMELLNLPLPAQLAFIRSAKRTDEICGVYRGYWYTPAYALVNTADEWIQNAHISKYPLFVKTTKAGDSLGVDEHSLVHNREELKIKLPESLMNTDPCWWKNISAAGIYRNAGRQWWWKNGDRF